VIARRLSGALLVVCVIALLQGCAVGRFLAGAPPDRNAPAPTHELLARRCGGCHDIPNPARMSGDDWRASLADMRRRFPLPESEWDSLAAMALDASR